MGIMFSDWKIIAYETGNAPNRPTLKNIFKKNLDFDGTTKSSTIMEATNNMRHYWNH